MKFLYPLFAALLLSINLQGQMQEGQWAPPFLLKDIDGQEHRLYDYLAEGKPVILNLAAAWCPPCWDEHQSRVLHQIWEAYGPEGTDEVMILFVEADPQTSAEQLSGHIGPTMGNWIVDTPFPIIDVQDYLIPNSYGLLAFPTVLLICPDLQVKAPQLWHGLGSWTVDNIMNQVLTCEQETPLANDVIIYSYEYNQEDCYSGAVNVELINGGATPLTSAEITLKRNGQPFDSYFWEGALALGEGAFINFDNLELLPGENIFEASVSISDELEENNRVEIPFWKSPATSQDLIIYVQADGNAEEDQTRWYIEDEQGNVVAESGPISNLEFVETTVSLEQSGCYQFFVADNGRDGLTTGGFILASDDNETIIFDDSNFGSGYSRSFLADNTVGVEETVDGLQGWQVFPNPSAQQVNIALELKQASNISVEWFSLLGEKMGSLQPGSLGAGTHQMTVDLTGLPPGTYLIQLHTDEGSVSRKVVKY